MRITKRLSRCLLLCVLLAGYAATGTGQAISIRNNTLTRKLVFGNRTMTMTLDYKNKASITSLVVNGQQVLDTATGIYSLIRTSTASYSGLRLSSGPVVTVNGPVITVHHIAYGDESHAITDTWTFTVTPGSILFAIDRTLSAPIPVEEAALPVFMFGSINSWEGAYQDYGGLAWFYLFNKKYDTYGVHSTVSEFWNSRTGNGLRVQVEAPGRQVAMSYSRTGNDQLAYRIALSEQEMLPRFDSGTQRRRYTRDTMDVWAPFTMQAGSSHQRIRLSSFKFNDVYGRGHFAGIDGKQVSSVLNTIARIGVIDQQHFGGNSWHTPYGPICLHEQYIAQMGLAINDAKYLKGYQSCLDFYRDNAIKPDGRVWPRWAYNNEDMMPGEVTDKGFYEAQWGYLLDANPDLVTNVAELYDQTGDIAWVKTHQHSCEKALDWLLARDSNQNGLVEMITDSHTQKRGSDWIDIIWSAYENAFVNAKLYHALVLWADIEKQLGDKAKSDYYAGFAGRLKTSFNKPVTEGGFWDNDKQCYIHWRDKDGSVHGNNMVTPVNFMAIGYGICDDSLRATAILDNIEAQMQKEQLFFWPICMFTYEKGEGNDWQFPFPRYENGDIFLSWGALGVKAYAAYKPVLALKYVKNVLAQYAKDGLAFQRYGRAKQDGLGDDILSGNSLSVVGLYQAIYGINPLHNRFYLNPHITPELAGTQLRYTFREQVLQIGLAIHAYSISNGVFKVTAGTDFGFYSSPHQLCYFNGNRDTASLTVVTGGNSRLAFNIQEWTENRIAWTQSSGNTAPTSLLYTIGQLKPGSYYTISVDKKIRQPVKADTAGNIVFNYKTGKTAAEIVIRPIAE